MKCSRGDFLQFAIAIVKISFSKCARDFLKLLLLKILIYFVWQHLRQLVYSLNADNIQFRVTRGEGKLYQCVKKSLNVLSKIGHYTKTSEYYFIVNFKLVNFIFL